MIRNEITELAKLGPLPDAQNAEEGKLRRQEELLGAITKPVSDEEACVLCKLFGQDGCYGIEAANSGRMPATTAKMRGSQTSFLDSGFTYRQVPRHDIHPDAPSHGPAPTSAVPGHAGSRLRHL
jgi:hypothetical protein